MKAWHFLIEVNKVCGGFTSIERAPEKASNSELKRWLQNKAIRINGATPGPDDELEFPITDLILFHKSDKKRITVR